MIARRESSIRTRSSGSSVGESSLAAAPDRRDHSSDSQPAARHWDAMPSTVRPMFYPPGMPSGPRTNEQSNAWNSQNLASIWRDDFPAGGSATSPISRHAFPPPNPPVSSAFFASPVNPNMPFSPRDDPSPTFSRNLSHRHSRGPPLRSETATSLSGGTENSPSPEQRMWPGEGMADRTMAPLGRHITNLSMNGAYVVVEFKLHRAEVYRFGPSWNEPVNSGSMVIVEADRGIDLGKVITIVGGLKEAREIKKIACKKHYEQLLRDARSSQNTPKRLLDEAFELYYEEHCEPATTHGFGSGDQHVPRFILRSASDQEIHGLAEKEGMEQRALRTARKKVGDYGLDSFEIVEAEYQFDQGKLTYYFSSRVWQHFNRMIVDLFKTFKTRIWLTALNPVTFRRSLPQQEHMPPYHMNHAGAPFPPNNVQMHVQTSVPSIWTSDPLSPRSRPVRSQYPSYVQPFNVHAPTFAPIHGLGYAAEDEMNERFHGVLSLGDE